MSKTKKIITTVEQGSIFVSKCSRFNCNKGVFLWHLGKFLRTSFFRENPLWLLLPHQMQSSDLKILSQQDLDQSCQPHTKFYDFDFLAKTQNYESLSLQRRFFQRIEVWSNFFLWLIVSPNEEGTYQIKSLLHGCHYEKICWANTAFSLAYKPMMTDQYFLV